MASEKSSVAAAAVTVVGKVGRPIVEIKPFPLGCDTGKVAELES